MRDRAPDVVSVAAKVKELQILMCEILSENQISSDSRNLTEELGVRKFIFR